MGEGCGCRFLYWEKEFCGARMSQSCLVQVNEAAGHSVFPSKVTAIFGFLFFLILGFKPYKKQLIPEDRK